MNDLHEIHSGIKDRLEHHSTQETIAHANYNPRRAGYHRKQINRLSSAIELIEEVRAAAREERNG